MDAAWPFEGEEREREGVRRRFERGLNEVQTLNNRILRFQSEEAIPGCPLLNIDWAQPMSPFSPSPPPTPPTPSPRWLLAHTHVTIGWFFNVTLSLALVYGATWLVVNVAPEAAGAGVAEVTAYLNGCFMPKVCGVGGGGGGGMVIAYLNGCFMLEVCLWVDGWVGDMCVGG
jgi:hypothetical protein